MPGLADMDTMQLLGPARGGLEGALSSFETARLTGSSGGAVSTGPILRDFEAAARDARHYAKSVDDILQLVRQQVFDFRRWILSTEAQSLHAMIRANAYVSSWSLLALTRRPKGLHNPLLGSNLPKELQQVSWARAMATNPCCPRLFFSCGELTANTIDSIM